MLAATTSISFELVRSSPLGVLALRPPRRCRLRSAAAFALPVDTWHKLQSDLQMAAYCAGLGGAQEMPSCKPSLAAASTRPEAIE